MGIRRPLLKIYCPPEPHVQHQAAKKANELTNTAVATLCEMAYTWVMAKAATIRSLTIQAHKHSAALILFASKFIPMERYPKGKTNQTPNPCPINAISDT